MILFWKDNRRRLCQTLDWSLYSANGERIRLESEEALRAYLCERPDTGFYLQNYRLREDMATFLEIDDPRMADYGPESEHIFCGAVRYDSAVGRVVSNGG